MLLVGDDLYNIHVHALHDNYKQYKSNCVKKCHAIFGPGQ